MPCRVPKSNYKKNTRIRYGLFLPGINDTAPPLGNQGLAFNLIEFRYRSKDLTIYS